MSLTAYSPSHLRLNTSPAIVDLINGSITNEFGVTRLPTSSYRKRNSVDDAFPVRPRSILQSGHKLYKSFDGFITREDDRHDDDTPPNSATSTDGQGPPALSDSSTSSPLDNSQLLQTPTLGDDDPQSHHRRITAAVDVASSPAAREYHVHFRPRVRITSGIGRHKRHDKQSSTAMSGGTQSHALPLPIPRPQRDLTPPSLSPDSSLSSSPSSSISVPLRTHSDGDSYNSSWGPLGQRVGMLIPNSFPNSTSAGRVAKQPQQQEQERSERIQRKEHAPANERTPLLYPSRPACPWRERRTESISRGDEVWLSREIDAVFGPWPRRLFNYHWWWWYIEPVLCCRCLDEPDDY